MNAQRQYRVLYRHFLFRLMDVEMLAADARGDSSTLFGQFAALLVFVSVVFGWGAVITGGFKMPPEAMLTMGWSIERRMLAMTMLTVGVFAVLNWESTFLDRRDALALAPLPVRVRTLFAAKIAAVGTALGLTVAALNCLSASLWPLALAPDGCGIAGTLRFVAAYWVALAAAGAFYFCAVLGAQGIAAQLPRRWYLRVSPFLQVGAFAVILAVFCLEPTLNTAQALGAPENQRALAWLPSYWFLGLLNELSGAFEAQGHAVMAPLARRAAEGLAIAGCVAGAAFLLSYFRTLRKVVEEPDIAPGARGGLRLPRFGSAPQTALAQFVIRTLARSRQHRVILAFYLGIGFAVSTAYVALASQSGLLAGTDFLRQANLPMMGASIVMLCAWALGTRVVFSRPIDLRANWVFRVTPVRGGADCLAAVRRATLAVSGAPAWAGCAALLLWFWPWRPAAEHLLFYGILASLLADVSLYGFRKIPFTCSYLPGRSKVHIMFWLCIALPAWAIHGVVNLEQGAMRSPAGYGGLVLCFAAAAAAARLLSAARARRNGIEIQFEEAEPGALLSLDLKEPE